MIHNKEAVNLKWKLQALVRHDMCLLFSRVTWQALFTEDSKYMIKWIGKCSS